MLAFLGNSMPIRNEWDVEKHISLTIRLPGLLPKVVWKIECIECVAIDNVSSMCRKPLRIVPYIRTLVQYVRTFGAPD